MRKVRCTGPHADAIRVPERSRTAGSVLRLSACALLASLAAAGVGAAQDHSIETLLARLQDPSGDQRMAAVATLGQLGPDASDAVPALILRLDQSAEAQERLAMVSALGRIGTIGR